MTDAEHAAALEEISRLMATDPKADTPTGQRLAALADAVELHELRIISLADGQGWLIVEAWEKLMRWRSARPLPAGVFYREISPNCNPEDPSPVLIAEWGKAPRGNDDGAMAIGATGATYGEAAVKLVGMLGLE